MQNQITPEMFKEVMGILGHDAKQASKCIGLTPRTLSDYVTGRKPIPYVNFKIYCHNNFLEPKYIANIVEGRWSLFQAQKTFIIKLQNKLHMKLKELDERIEKNEV